MKPMDARGWVALGLFALVFYILSLIAFVPALATNELFKTLAVAIVTGGFIGGAVAFYYSSNKASADKDVTISKQLDKTP